MLRRLPLLALALTLWFTAEPLVHSHPLSAAGNSANTCAVCTTGVDRPVSAPALAAPLHLIAILKDAPAAASPVAATIILASRAPPAA